MIRPVAPTDSKASLVALAASTGIFQPGEAEMLLGETLDHLYANALGDHHYAFVSVDDEAINGWVYLSIMKDTDRVWNLWWIGVAPGHQGKGVGRRLMEFVEAFVRQQGARILLVETSATDMLAKTRAIYTRWGFTNCGEIPDFYADGEGKVTFWKRIL
ncbi:hypothetical protein DYB25_001292 [Aphanomyces astaci]|uniref:N-acetyltransferase domain-containing protein n=1 Tax=Aphanomyces astaci TaxID=112090 RepID=A0A397C3J0_APHAT|nr:hypothetical protein AaE_004375 [Aphanomyces astaci]RHY09507.1 hypothetical protein DYB36_000231 [Aphanomyces astaci]RHY19743.1 hypothetical protein DYB25_001292 [Aphanomyces astaci]RHY37785.1 hypothetical protein DYB38_007331 [Aphanomyces astaci]RHY39139.1 hypothetical protein DYB30_000231 [Aphanomyces astaci]